MSQPVLGSALLGLSCTATAQVPGPVVPIGIAAALTGSVYVPIDIYARDALPVRQTPMRPGRNPYQTTWRTK